MSFCLLKGSSRQSESRRPRHLSPSPRHIRQACDRSSIPTLHYPLSIAGTGPSPDRTGTDYRGRSYRRGCTRVLISAARRDSPSTRGPLQLVGGCQAWTKWVTSSSMGKLVQQPMVVRWGGSAALLYVHHSGVLHTCHRTCTRGAYCSMQRVYSTCLAPLSEVRGTQYRQLHPSLECGHTSVSLTPRLRTVGGGGGGGVAEVASALEEDAEAVAHVSEKLVWCGAVMAPKLV